MSLTVGFAQGGHNAQWLRRHATGTSCALTAIDQFADIDGPAVFSRLLARKPLITIPSENVVY